MSLLHEIRDDALDSKVNIADLLRKCKVLAFRLGNDEFKKWVDQELNGYSSKEDLPQYRILNVQSFGDFAGPFQSGLRNAPIAPSCIAEEYRDIVDTAFLTEPISSLVYFVENNKDLELKSDWPADLIRVYGQKIYKDMNCLTAWRLIPRGPYVAIIDTIRTRILNFILEIEAEAPNAGEVYPDSQAIAPERISQVFHTHVYGNVANFAAGSKDFTQVNIEVHQGDLESLNNYLAKLGISQPDIKELETAVGRDGNDKIGEHTGSWIGKIIGKAGSGALKIGSSVAGNILTKAISAYLGLPV